MSPVYPEEEHEPRTQHHVEDSAREAEANGTVYGVKGKSMLWSQIDITESVAIDYMHAVLGGITESSLSLCLDSKFHIHCFYLGTPFSTQEIHKRLNRIKPQ